MKTFYTLLLAFGLCLTSHAQKYIVLNSNNVNNNFDNDDWVTINSFLDDSETILKCNNLNTNSSLKKVILSQSGNCLEQLSNQVNLSNVQLLKIEHKENEQFIFSDKFLSKLSSLKYVYITSYSQLDDEIVGELFKSIGIKLPNVVCLYSNLKNN